MHLLQVLIATDEVMDWISAVLMQTDQLSLFYDLGKARIKVEVERQYVTTTQRTTVLASVSFIPIFSVTKLGLGDKKSFKVTLSIIQ